MVSTTRTNDEFGLDASVFGTRTSNEMWARDEVSMARNEISMAAIKGGPCPPLMMRMNASASAMTTRRYGVTAGSNASEESSTEIDLSLKMNPTMKMNAITRGRGPIELLVGGEWKQCLSRARTLKNKQEGLEDKFKSRPESRQRRALKKSTVEIMRMEDSNGVGNANITRNVRTPRGQNAVGSSCWVLAGEQSLQQEQNGMTCKYKGYDGNRGQRINSRLPKMDPVDGSVRTEEISRKNAMEQERCLRTQNSSEAYLNLKGITIERRCEA